MHKHTHICNVLGRGGWVEGDCEQVCNAESACRCGREWQATRSLTSFMGITTLILVVSTFGGLMYQLLPIVFTVETEVCSLNAELLKDCLSLLAIWCAYASNVQTPLLTLEPYLLCCAESIPHRRKGCT